MTETNKLPVWFWVVSIVALLWNLLGLGAFLSTSVFMTTDALASMTPEQQELYVNTPSWANVAYGVAVICGVLGSIGLLLKQDWAAPVFVISLLGLIVQMVYAFGMSNSFEVYGAAAAAMPVMIFIGCIFFIWFAHSSAMKGWLD